MSELLSATIRRVWRESPRYLGLVLEVPPAVAAAYTRPGQIVRLELDGRRVPVAIASSPGEHAALELLLGPPLAERPFAVGDRVTLGGPEGAGFPLDVAAGREVYLFAQGSGLAPLRPVIEALLSEPGPPRRLWVAAAEGEQPYLDYDRAWAALGLEIERTTSRPYFEERLLTAAPDLSGATAFLAGHPRMMSALKDALTRLGLPPERIATNW